jgi:hypothetical protein
MVKTIQELGRGEWVTWTDRGRPQISQLDGTGGHTIGMLPKLGTEVHRIVWTGSKWNTGGKVGEVRETLLYDGHLGEGFFDFKHVFRKKK